MWITNPNISEYIMSIVPERSKELEVLHKIAIDRQIPIIRLEIEEILKLILNIHKPRRILEIGTAIGYSSIMMMEILGKDTKIVTLEKSKELVKIAKNNIEKFGYKSAIQVIQGDAINTMLDLDEPFDMIFIDAAKGQYDKFYKLAIPLLTKTGMIIGDNILQEGLVAKSRFAIPRRQRTIHKRMRDIIQKMMANKMFTTTVLPIGDGIMISYKREEQI